LTIGEVPEQIGVIQPKRWMIYEVEVTNAIQPKRWMIDPSEAMDDYSKYDMVADMKHTYCIVSL